MTGIFYKLLVTLSLNLIISVPLYAMTTEQKTINFSVKAEGLKKGEVQYYFSILSPGRLAVQHPDIFELDSLSLIQESDVMIMISKAVYTVGKPVSFFDDKNLLDEKYLKHIMGEQKITKLSPDAVKVQVPGKDGYTYVTKSFFDADDISTLPNSKIIRGVTAAKNLDVISKGASTIMFTEKTQFTKYTEGGVSVSSYIPMNERKTLIITYNLWAVRKPFADPAALKKGFLTEIEAVKELQESYKP